MRPACPLGLAVIPAGATASLAGALPEVVDVLVHGFAHANHAVPGDQESRSIRRAASCRTSCGQGASGSRPCFGERALPVFVPPWNRMAEDAAAALPAAGYRVLSGYRGRPEGPLPRLDTHVDLVDWRGGRRFAGADAVLGALAAALAARRDASDPRPTGVLTHHMAHDAAAWEFLEALLAWGEVAPGVRWVRPRDAIPDPVAA